MYVDLESFNRFQVEDNEVEDNTAGGNAGGLYFSAWYDSHGTFDGNEFSDNRAGNESGGAYVELDYNSSTTFYDNKWTIKDPRIRAEVKALADRIEAGLTPDQRAFEQRRRRDLHRKPYERDDDMRAPMDTVRQNEERIQLSERFDVAQRSRGLDARERDLDEREKRLAEKEQQFAVSHGPSVRYQLHALQEMNNHIRGPLLKYIKQRHK